MKTTKVRCAFVFLCALLCSGCATLTAISVASKALKTATPGWTLPDDKVVIVGRITFSPEPVQKGDMRVMTVTGIMDMKRTSDAAFVKAGSENVDVRKYQWDHYGQVRWGEYFAFVFPRHSISLRGVGVPMRIAGNGSDNITVHCWLDFEVSPDDRVVYVGDMEFRLYDTNSMGGTVQSVRICDTYAEARKTFDMAFRDTSGAPLPLIQRLATGESAVSTTKQIVRQVYRPY